MKLLVTLLAVFTLAACATKTPDSRPSGAATDSRIEDAGGDSAAAESAAATPAEGEAKKPRVVCSTQPVSGTRLPNRRVCKTEEEWAVIEKESQETVEHIQRLPIPINEAG